MCDKIIERVGQEHRRQVNKISQESFYVDLSPEQVDLAEKGEFDFDHPGSPAKLVLDGCSRSASKIRLLAGAFQDRLMLDTLLQLKAGKTVAVPTYDFVTHSRCCALREALIFECNA